MNKGILSKVVEIEVRGKTYKVSPLPIGKLIELAPKMERLANFSEKKLALKDQANIFVDILYEVLKLDNPEITKQEILNTIGMDAGARIIEIATGQNFMNVK